MTHPAQPRRVAAIRHLAFEDLGLFGETLSAVGWHLSYHDAGLEDLALPHKRPTWPSAVGSG